MLQRIQTIWMFLAVLAAVFLYFTGQDVDIMGTIPVITIVSVALALLSLFSIFNYRNRKRQILLNNVSIFINALLIGLLVYWLLNLPGGIQFPEKGIELAFPLIAIVALLIANVYIIKDEKLVKSVDRFR
ncbi:DUF4293 domain-containing protein [Elizabethkingia meningoseptica]|uniref:DUF4293 domain-containing protein n=1 Tax=Elizabethkingia meningoseptica TaxID=238 RepID=UPI00301A58ED